MVRSFGYAARVALQTHVTRRSGDRERLEPWARTWQHSVSAVFLHAYRRVAGAAGILPPTAEGFEQLLEAYLLEKCLYELRYELNNRPAWVGVPLRGIVELLEREPVARELGS
jgi:maltose alpha-D-glucosyltransferase/alpha-amylase